MLTADELAGYSHGLPFPECLTADELAVRGYFAVL